MKAYYVLSSKDWSSYLSSTNIFYGYDFYFYRRKETYTMTSDTLMLWFELRCIAPAPSLEIRQAQLTMRAQTKYERIII